LTDQTLAAIRQAARSGALQPEQLYSAYQIAAMPGVSRSPVREALMRLVEADMIKLERNRGFRVVIPGPASVVGVFQLRLLLEVPAARRAALTVREAFPSKRADRRISQPVAQTGCLGGGGRGCWDHGVCRGISCSRGVISRCWCRWVCVSGCPEMIWCSWFWTR
jgi:Bacterial regulatory proteins, gntR family